MKLLHSIVLAGVLLATGIVALAQSEPPTLAADGLDPVALCQGREMAGRASHTSEYLGMTYRFASAANKARFDEAPERWGAQREAECAVMPGVPADPEIYAVHDQRLYLFGTTHCRDAFVENPEVYLTERRRVALLVFEGMELLDFAGPGEVFQAAGRGAFDVYTVATTTEPITSQHFVRIIPEYSIEDAPEPDILVIPGGATGSVVNSEATMRWVRRVAEQGEHVVSVCNGAGVLARLGLLDGLTVTSHHSAIPGLRGFGTFEVLDNARYVDNGKIITTAGVSAGIDGSLHLVEQLLGTNVALQTARYMEYDWDYAGQIDTAYLGSD